MTSVESMDMRSKGQGGRLKISDQKRTRSFSMRAAKGNIDIMFRKCPHCNHHKAKINNSKNSPVFDRAICTRCKQEV